MRDIDYMIKDYNKFLDDNLIDDRRLENTIQKSKKVVVNRESKYISYIEFIYRQSTFIKKRWWLLQMLVLFTLWIMLRDAVDETYIQKLLGIGSPIFAVFLLPEIWKNITNSCTEIEDSSYYPLRKIYSARILLFALIDITLITIFFIFTKVPVKIFLINFVIPFNVCCCIIFDTLCKYRNRRDYSAIAFVIWTTIWVLLSSNNKIYNFIAGPIWIFLLFLSFVYFAYYVKKVSVSAKFLWEDI